MMFISLAVVACIGLRFCEWVVLLLWRLADELQFCYFRAGLLSAMVAPMGLP
jgi:hypothetical protein